MVTAYDFVLNPFISSSCKSCSSCAFHNGAIDVYVKKMGPKEMARSVARSDWLGWRLANWSETPLTSTLLPNCTCSICIAWVRMTSHAMLY